MSYRESIHIRTSDEIDTFLYSAEKIVARAGLRFRGRKVSKEPLVNALLASFLDRDPKEIETTIRQGLERYEKQLESADAS